MILCLFIIFFVLLVAIGGERGVNGFFTLCFQAIMLILTLVLVNSGLNAIVVTLAVCIVIAIVTLIAQNGCNVKTISAFVAVGIVLVMMTLFITQITTRAKIQGFSSEQQEISESDGFLDDGSLSMVDIEIAVILIGFMGAIMDTALAITSAMKEVDHHNPELTRKRLFSSGLTIGREILGTMINTLFFAFIGEMLTLLILLNKEYTFVKLINSKLFVSELLKILFSGIGSVLIIPTAAVIGAYCIKQKGQALES
ncbi:integral membrane protein [Lachnospiraceae bacterium KM106-2]|nr:integral membrane protein [Lachnospiraceae bacterium KM106-2]